MRMVVACSDDSGGRKIGRTFLKYLWTNCVRNELDWGSRYNASMGFSHAVAVMDTIGGREKRNGDENQNWCSLWRMHVDLYQSNTIAAARGFDELHTHYRSNQQDLGSSLCSLRMVTTALHGAPRMQLWSQCNTTMNFSALCSGGCCGIRLRAN